MDPQGQLVCGGAEAQTRQALENLKRVLDAGGASLESVVKTSILLARMGDFQVVNQVYAECKYFYGLTLLRHSSPSSFLPFPSYVGVGSNLTGCR